MSGEFATKIQKVKTAMDARYENKQSNKKTDISGSFTNDTDSYPTVQAVKTYVEGKNYISTSGTSGLVKNDGTIDTNVYLTQHQDISNYVQKSQTAGLIKNDGSIDTNVYLTQHQSLSDIGGEVSVAVKSSANSGMFKTYQIKQDGTSVGEIDIPRDFLVKSGSVKTVGSTATTAESDAGLSTGDIYISLIINAKDSSTSSGNEELIIPANGLVEDTTYNADNSTLQISNSNVFSIKASGVDTTQIKDGAVTADKIDSTVKNSWLTTANVQAEINQALDDLAELINPTTQG